MIACRRSRYGGESLLTNLIMFQILQSESETIRIRRKIIRLLEAAQTTAAKV